MNLELTLVECHIFHVIINTQGNSRFGAFQSIHFIIFLSASTQVYMLYLFIVTKSTSKLFKIHSVFLIDALELVYIFSIDTSPAKCQAGTLVAHDVLDQLSIKFQIFFFFGVVHDYD